MQVPYELVEKTDSQSKLRWLALTTWCISISLIVAASVIGLQERANPVRFIDLIVTAIAFGLFGTVGALIAWQRPRNAIGWLFCAVGIGTAITDFSAAYAMFGTIKGHLPLPGAGAFNLLGDAVWPFNWVSLLVFLPLLFPNGHPLTRRWHIVGWLAATLGLLSILAGVLSDVNMEIFGKANSADFWGSVGTNLNLLGLPLFIAALVSLVLRFIRARGRERQQIKWLTYGAVTMAVIIFVGIFILNDQSNLTFDLGIMCLPLSIGISILRTQLYDIDRLISRTLIYLLLSALLILIYLALVLGLQLALQGITRDSPLPIVASTLAVAALFQPLRRAIQRVIDRSFYRHKYNAERVLTSFGATLHRELDLTQLSEQLMAVVQETMQPAHISLWLRESGTEKTTMRETPDRL